LYADDFKRYTDIEMSMRYVIFFIRSNIVW